MPWQEPKTDWQPDDPVGAADLNRIEDNIAYLRYNAVPSGVIVMWSGSADNIPVGWALCDGTNGTPDLRNRFVVGAGTSYEPGDTGGSASVTLTVDQLPSHKHSASTESAGSHNHDATTNADGQHTHSYTFRDWAREVQTGGITQNIWAGTASANTSSAGSHTHTVTINSAGSHSHSVTVDNTGGGQAHENRPPYYALCFIMKL